MNRLISNLSIAAFLVAGFTAGTGDADEEGHFAVTVTNLTRGQVFTPILVASHAAGVMLYELGQPASVPLEHLAEAGDTGPLKQMLSSMREVLDVTDSGAPLPPGHSVTIKVQTRGEFDHVSVASMLVPTNDAFFAVNDAEGPEGERTITLYSPAYKAGTEAADELCIHIPGPPNVCQGEGFNPSRAGAENFVHVHSGIHGVGDLKAADRDWRNPVARIVIRRVH